MIWRVVWVLSVSLIVLPALARAEEMKAEQEKPSTAPAEKSKQTARLYRFKSHRTTGKGDTASIILSLSDLVSGKTDTLYLATGDAALAEAVKKLSPGTPVEVLTERRNGRPTVVAVKDAPLAPGEDRPNVYVLVEWDKKKQVDGKPMMAVKLKKFGREFMAIIPLTHNRQSDDWAAPGTVEDTLNKVQPGGVLEADIKPGNPPVVRNMVLYRPPEQGKFLEFTQHEMQGGNTAAAFKMLARDGITVTVTLPGTAKVINGTKVLAPDPAQLRKVQAIKPDSEVEITLMPGDQYILRDIKVLSPPPPKAVAPAAERKS
jgi:hypothetical protein